MPRSKIDSWLMQQAGKPADPDEPANLPVSGGKVPMAQYKARDGSQSEAYTRLVDAVQALDPVDNNSMWLLPNAMSMSGMEFAQDAVEWVYESTLRLRIVDNPMIVRSPGVIRVFYDIKSRSRLFIPVVV